MQLFIDSKKEPTVYTNLFGKTRKDFNNARIATKMDGRFKGKLTLKNKKNSLDGFDGYVYKYPGTFGSEVNIYDDTARSNVTPGMVAESAEKVITHVGKGLIKRVYIAPKSHSEDPNVDAVITKDIAILDGNRSYSANELDEILYIYGLCSLCDYNVRLNKDHNYLLYYETSSESILRNFFEEQQKGVSPIGKNEGWHFGYITGEIFNDKDFEGALRSAEKIVKEIKDCAVGEDFTFAKIATLYFKDHESLKRNYYDYFLVMKRMIKIHPIGDKPKLVTKRGELDKIINGDAKPKHAEVINDEERDKIWMERAKYLGEEVLSFNDPNHKLPGEE